MDCQMLFNESFSGEGTFLDSIRCFADHLLLEDVSDNKAVFKLPPRFRICKHPPVNPQKAPELLGEGSFGRVYAISEEHVEKRYDHTSCFYQE